MEPIVEVFRRTARTVPVFSDKHFSYSLAKAKQMYAWSRELNYPVMAGSSIPLTLRAPGLEIPYGGQIENALTLGYGELDAYGFHTLEALQCMVERRKGGETGIRSVAVDRRRRSLEVARRKWALEYPTARRPRSRVIRLSNRDASRTTLNSRLSFCSSISMECRPPHTCSKGM